MKYNILYLDSSLKIGGGQRSLLDLVSNIDKNMFNPIVACPKESDLVRELKKLGIKTYFVDIISKSSKKTKAKTRVANSFLKIRKIIKKEKIGLVHTNTSKTWLIAGFAAKLMKVPLVAHNRDLTSHGFLDRIAVSMADIIINNSNTSAQKFSYLNKNLVVYNWVDKKSLISKKSRKEIRKEFNIRSNILLIGTVGRISPEKGQIYLVKAAPIIKKEIPNAKFIIVGDIFLEGDIKYKNNLLKLIKQYKLEKDFIFTGYRKDFVGIIKAMGVFVLPSLREGFGRVVVEAMLAKTPVVATDCGGTREIIQNNKTGFFVKTKDEFDLAEKVIKIIRNKRLAQQFRKTAEKEAKERFSMEKNIKKIQNLYIKLLNPIK